MASTSGFRSSEACVLKSATGYARGYLLEEILNTAKYSPNITFGEYLEKAKKDVEIRGDLILKARSLRLSRYQKQIELFVELLYAENHYVRAQLSMIRTELDIGDQEQRIRNLDEYLGSNLRGKIQVKSAKQRKIYLERLKSKRGELKTAAERWLAMEMALRESMPQYRTIRNLIPPVQEKIRQLAAFD